jgi:hypothetical protein
MSDVAHQRGYYGERRIAKLVKGVIVGRSKAVITPTGKTIKINQCQPPDVVNDVFSFESKYTRSCPKMISNAMLQAKTNAPEGLTPVAVIKDSHRGTYLYVLEEKDFISLWG